MKCLVDTNILLRLVQKNSPMHLDTQRAILKLKKQGEFLCIIPQNIIEFWAVATRPLDKNGLGLSITQAEEESEKKAKNLKRYLYWNWIHHKFLLSGNLL
jgi:predicted nucleic acid-binding protein